MKILVLSRTLVAAAMLLPAVLPAAQQSFPSKPIRMLVPFSPGSQTDILARWIGEKMAENWGQQVVVDNRPSAGGTIASQYVLQANPRRTHADDGVHRPCGQCNALFQAAV